LKRSSPDVCACGFANQVTSCICEAASGNGRGRRCRHRQLFHLQRRHRIIAIVRARNTHWAAVPAVAPTRRTAVSNSPRERPIPVHHHPPGSPVKSFVQRPIITEQPGRQSISRRVGFDDRCVEIRHRITVTTARKSLITAILHGGNIDQPGRSIVRRAPATGFISTRVLAPFSTDPPVRRATAVPPHRNDRTGERVGLVRIRPRTQIPRIMRTSRSIKASPWLPDGTISRRAQLHRCPALINADESSSTRRIGVADTMHDERLFRHLQCRDDTRPIRQRAVDRPSPANCGEEDCIMPG